MPMSKAFGSRYSIEDSQKTTEYFEFVKDLLDSDVVNEMKKYRHHYSTTCYQHCINVSYYNYLVCRKLGLNSKSAARAGLLHDLFLYDWHTVEKKEGEKPHGMRHPKIALKNAKEHFEIGLSFSIELTEITCIPCPICGKMILNCLTPLSNIG